jgi:hypothetical protein
VFIGDPDGYNTKFSKEYRKAVFSFESIVLHVDAGPFSEKIVIPSPVTAGSIVDALDYFFNTPISNAQYRILEDKYNRDRWIREKFPTMQKYKQYYRTYAHLLGDRHGFEGLCRLKDTNHYVPQWGS